MKKVFLLLAIFFSMVVSWPSLALTPLPPNEVIIEQMRQHIQKINQTTLQLEIRLRQLESNLETNQVQENCPKVKKGITGIDSTNKRRKMSINIKGLRSKTSSGSVK